MTLHSARGVAVFKLIMKYPYSVISENINIDFYFCTVEKVGVFGIIHKPAS